MGIASPWDWGYRNQLALPLNLLGEIVCREGINQLYLVSRNNAADININSACMSNNTTQSVQPYGKMSTIEGGLHIPSLPPFHTSIGNTTYNFKDMVYTLQGGIIVVPLMSALATITIAKSYSHGKPIETSQEFLSLSLANTFGGFLGAMPATGVIIAGAVASTCNVKTTFAGVYSGMLSVLTLTFLTPYMYFIPKASLSAVIIFSVMVKLNIKTAYSIWKTDKSGFIIMIITMFLTLFRTLSEGLIGGILLSMIQLICTWSRPQISVDEHKVPQSKETYIEIKPDRGMYFPASETLRDIAIKHQDKKHPIVVNCSNFTEIDYTSLQAIQSLSNELRLNGQELILMTGNPKFKEKINFATNVTVCLDENELNNHITLSVKD
ncbi:sodium-independent sulfate anion transporter-like [Lycorma delicatula]|uniref:sodium-independent sulfate anion transporter-like n=1 Tax=Lycorma delicatula TaxID=130591 RepID=UPI003F515A60